MAGAADKAGADITFFITRKANFYFGVMQKHPRTGVLCYMEPSHLTTHVQVRGALLDRVVMTDRQSQSSAECYALEPPIGKYFLAGGQAQRLKDYPVIKPGTYSVVYNLAKTSPGPDATQAEQAANKRGHRTFLVQAGSNTLIHYGSLPEWTEGCVTVGQRPKIVVLKPQTDASGKSVNVEYDHVLRGGPNPALPAPTAQTDENQQALLGIAHATIRVQDKESALGAMLRIYDSWKQRNGTEPKMEAIVSGLDKIPHYDLNDPLQCPVGRELNF